TGRVLVSDLTCCPATVQLAFDATDCCSNGGAQDTDVVDVIDNYPPIGACGLTHDHPGCNNEGVSILLSGNQPSYWSAATGQPGPDQSVAPWDLLDAGWLPGRPDPDSEESGDRVLRGYVLAWAVNSTGEEIRWNHLKGDAMLINYRDTSALEYNAYAYQATGVDHGQLTGTPGELYMDGVEYDQNYEQLVLDFYASGIEEGFDTDLTLLPLGVDLRQDGDGPVCTKAAFDVWNEEEVGPMRHDRCICCWDQALLSNYDPPGGSIFMRDFLQTDKGVARIDGMESGVCPGSQDVPLLGVVAKHMNVTPDKNNVGRFGMTGMHLPGWGYDSSAVIRADVTPGGGTGEKPSGFVGGSAGQSETTALDGVGRERADGRGGAKTALINPTRVGVSHKGSLLIFPMVEVRWDWCGNLIQDTFIDLTNDYPENVNVQLYFVNGDEPEPAKLPRCIGH
ncbi:MAG: hypothetical protein GY842_16850, partial [bacterium]|nr:hypothetical protein [bacterium]